MSENVREVFCCRFKRNAAILEAINVFTARMVKDPDACRKYLAALAAKGTGDE